MPAASATQACQFFTIAKQPTSVVMSGNSDVPYAFVALYRNAVVNYRSRCDSSGEWNFYDMEDSGSQLYTITAYTQSGPTGEIWTATVDGTTVVVTKLFGSQRAVAAAFA